MVSSFPDVTLLFLKPWAWLSEELQRVPRVLVKPKPRRIWVDAWGNMWSFSTVLIRWTTEVWAESTKVVLFSRALYYSILVSHIYNFVF